jgi:hypothetical protein
MTISKIKYIYEKIKEKIQDISFPLKRSIYYTMLMQRICISSRKTHCFLGGRRKSTRAAAAGCVSVKCLLNIKMYLSGLMVKVNYVGRGSVSRQDSRARGGQEDTKERKGTEDGRLGQENGKGGRTGVREG